MDLEVREKLRLIAGSADDKKADDIHILELKGLTVLTDYFVICTGENQVQIKTIVDHIEINLKKKGYRPIGIEGRTYGNWVLMDYNDIIVHIFDRETRAYYDLDKLWLDAPRLDLDEFLVKALPPVEQLTQRQCSSIKKK